jgi:alpha-L-arabinofuranosidase
VRKSTQKKRLHALAAAVDYRIEPLESRILLSNTVTWKSTVGGSWNTAANWSDNAVPTSTSDVVISQPNNIQINLTGTVTINSLTLTGDTLNISAASLAVVTTITNSGTITLSSGSNVNVGGLLTQTSTGALTLPSGSLGTTVGTNLLSNPGFESPSADGSTDTPPDVWYNWGNSAVSTNYAHTGLQSLTASGPNSGVGQSLSASAGVSYTATVFAMTPAGAKLTGPEGGFMDLVWYTADGTEISQQTDTVLTSTSAAGGPNAGSVGNQGWNFYTMTVVAPAGAVSVEYNLDVGAYTGNNGTAGGVVYWDDAEFGLTAITSTNLAASSIDSNGTITIGASDTITVTGSFTQTSTANLDLLLGGPPGGYQFGSLIVGGAADLAGALTAALVNGYTPTISDSFNLVTYAAESGSFSSYQLPSGSTYAFVSSLNPTYFGISALPKTITTTVNATSVIDTANTNLLGVNVDYWDQQLPTTETQQMVQAAGLDTFRFPGGAASDDYHFNVSDNYYEGEITIPQFAEFVQSMGGTGMVTVDYGSGSPQEAEAELAYLAGSTTDNTNIGSGIEWNDATGQWDTVNWGTVAYWAKLRAATPLNTDDGLNFLRIDHPAPFTNITEWEIGNEQYGSWAIDHHGTKLPNGTSTGAIHDPATYALFAATFSQWITKDQANFPAISIGIDSEDPTGAEDNDWTENVLSDGFNKDSGFIPGFISDHSYMQSTGSESDSFLLYDTVSNSGSLLDWSTRYAAYESLLTSVLGSQASKVAVMATEFNSVSTDPGKQTTSLVNGLFIADSLGGLLDSGYTGGFVWDLRNGWQTNDNNSSTLYGWREGGDYGLIGDPSYTDLPSTGPYVPYPGYFAEQLASKLDQPGGKVVSVASSYSEVSTYGVLESDGDLELLVINKNPDAALTEQFNLSGFTPSGQATIWQYGEAQDYTQSLSTTGASSLAESAVNLTLSGPDFSYTFPAYSMTVIDLKPVVTPTVTSFIVNDGNPQRSKVDTLTVVFNEPVKLAANALSLVLLPAAGGSPIAQTFTLSNPSGDGQTYVLTPTGSNLVGGSLPNGSYEVIVTATGVTDSAGGSPASNQTFGFYRLYGDFFGAGTVNFSDLLLIAQTFNDAAGNPNYLWYVDEPGDGVVNFASLLALVQNFNATDHPTASLTSVPAAQENSPTTITATAAGPSADDTLSYQWTILQPNSAPFTLPNNGVTTTPSLTFTPNSAGNWSVSLVVTDTTTGLTASVPAQSFDVTDPPTNESDSKLTTVVNPLQTTAQSSFTFADQPAASSLLISDHDLLGRKRRENFSI